MKITHLLWLTMILATLACDGTATDGAGEDPAADLVGRWFERAPHDRTTSFDIRSDGTITAGIIYPLFGSLTIDGTWSAVDGVFSFEGDVTSQDYRWKRYRAERTYAVADGRFITDAFRPVAGEQGLVATWRSSLRRVIDEREDVLIQELILRADGTSSYERTEGGQTGVYAGTWTETDASVEHTYPNDYGSYTPMTFYRVGGALGLELHEQE